MSGRGGRTRGRWNGRGRGRSRSGQHQRHHRGPRQYHSTSRTTTSTSSGGDTTAIEEFGIFPSSSTPGSDSIAIAIQGCSHGAIDAIYDRLHSHTIQTGRKIDLLVCCGDFQSLRNTADFHSFAVPPKYHALGSFYQYYIGEKVAPVTTIFIGGNHEASQPLQELYYGGWVAPNIYYMGASGVVKFRGVRIGGLSGIYKGYDFTTSRYERPPYDRSTMRSVYHYRNVEAYRLSCLQPGKLDIMLSHDWPQGIEQYGDTNGLIRRKPFFREEIAKNALGSPPAMSLLHTLQPKYWFSAHLHVKFNASVSHSNQKANSTKDQLLIPTQAILTNPDTKGASTQSTTEFIAPESSGCSQQPDLTDLMTKFLSLDKCLPRRHYLSIVHIPASSEDEPVLQYDPEWLAVLRKTHEMSRAPGKRRITVPLHPEHCVDHGNINDILERLDGNCMIPNNFEPNVVTPPGSSPTLLPPLPWMGNPQTDQLLHKLDLEHLPNLTVPYDGPFFCPFEPDATKTEKAPSVGSSRLEGAGIKKQQNTATLTSVDDENEINLDDIDGDNTDTEEQAPNDQQSPGDTLPETKRPKLGDEKPPVQDA